MAHSYKVEYARRAVDDLNALRIFDHRKIIHAIDLHLSREPTRTSKSRIKEMVQPFWSQFRLRVANRARQAMKFIDRDFELDGTKPVIDHGDTSLFASACGVRGDRRSDVLALQAAD